MKIDVTDYKSGRQLVDDANKMLDVLEAQYIQTVMDYLVFPLLEKYAEHYHNPELKQFFPRVISALYKWDKNRSVEDREYGRFGYTEISRRAHNLALYTIIIHDMDFLTHEESYGGSSGTYWFHDEQEKQLWRGTPYYFDHNGFFINYEKADLELAKLAFELFYFAKIREEPKKVKQLTLF